MLCACTRRGLTCSEIIGGGRRFGMGGKYRGLGDGSPPAESRGGAPGRGSGAKSPRS